MMWKEAIVKSATALFRRQRLTAAPATSSCCHLRNLVNHHHHHHGDFYPRNAGIVRWHGGDAGSDQQHAPTIQLTFLQPDGETRKTVEARVGESLLQTAHRNEIDLEGACEGVCACSTCHLIFPVKVYDSLPEPSEDEEDMLDMAFGLTETSRLGCQITVTEEMDGIELEMPKATRNFYVDGHKPKPH